jgi:ACR3 family arsenite efflux pump ArsB
VIGSLAAFLIGCLVGFSLDLIPHAVEIAMRVDICRESCPAMFRVGSILVYLGMPLAWGTLSVFIFRQSTEKGRLKNVALALVASLVLILLMTWVAYAYQAGALK